MQQQRRCHLPQPSVAQHHFARTDSRQLEVWFPPDFLVVTTINPGETSFITQNIISSSASWARGPVAGMNAWLIEAGVSMGLPDPRLANAIDAKHERPERVVDAITRRDCGTSSENHV